MHSPKEVIISITNRCNSSCKMCEVPKNKPQDIPNVQCKQIIEDAFRIGAPTVVFSGGEPLLRDDIFDLILFTKKKHMRVCITSNGSLINEKIAFALAEVGTDVVNISIEGPQEVNDSLRGPGSFQKAISALCNLNKNKIEATIASTVSQYNFRHLYTIAEIALQHKVTTLKFQPFNALFMNDRTRESDFFISIQQAHALKQIMEKIIIFCQKTGIATNPQAYLQKIPLYLSKQSINGSACGALWASCPITSNGDIYPCWVIKDKKQLIGNIKERQLFDLWDSAHHNRIREKIKSKGCVGCMMSCYDESFKQDNLKSRLSFNAVLVKKNGLSVYFVKLCERWLKRLRFYLLCREPLFALLRRFKGYLGKRNKMSQLKIDKEISKERINSLLAELDETEKILEEKLKTLR